MMLDLRLSTKFKKDYARCRKRQYDMELLQSVVDVLRAQAPLPPLVFLPLRIIHASIE